MNRVSGSRGPPGCRQAGPRASYLAGVGAAPVVVTPPKASRSTPQGNRNLRAVEEPSARRSKLAPFLFKTRLFKVKFINQPKTCTVDSALNLMLTFHNICVLFHCIGFFFTLNYWNVATTLLHPLNTSPSGQARNLIPFQSNPIYCQYLNFFCCP